ncbi:MAG: methylation-associated defense system protein MAD4 [Verrucomicrobiia bacterium]
MNPSPQKDLVVLVADKDMEHAIRGILKRPRALGIRPVTTDVFTHPERDPGCYLRSHTFLRSMFKKYSKAIVLFDHDGCGAEDKTRDEMEAEVEGKLAETGWKDRSRVIVLNPELEVWLWSDSPHVPEVLGWKSPASPLPMWLKQEGYWREGEAKPHAPKEAMEAALRAARRPRSSSLYLQLAETVSLERCTDPAFVKLKNTLREWFLQQ